MLGCLTMCALSVNDGEQQCGHNDGDRNLCDDWKDRAENWVQNEMMYGHLIENGDQKELTDGRRGAPSNVAVVAP